MMRAPTRTTTTKVSVNRNNRRPSPRPCAIDERVVAVFDRSTTGKRIADGLHT